MKFFSTIITGSWFVPIFYRNFALCGTLTFFLFSTKRLDNSVYNFIPRIYIYMKFSGRFHQQVCAHLTFTVIIVFMILQTRRSSSKFHPYLFVRNNCGCCEKKKKKKRKSRLRRQSTTAGSSYIPAVHRSFNEPLKRLAKRLREGKPRQESETTGTVFKLCARLSTLQRLRENSCFAILSLPCRQQIAVIHINPAFTATSKRDR